MTAPTRQGITPDLVERFADYHRRHDAWGVFHVQFADGNYEIGAHEYDDPLTDEEQGLVAAFNELSVTQRKKLCRLAEART